MTYPTYTKQDLSDFSGRPVVSYKAYAETSALPQALLLFKLGTCLASLPENAEDAELARLAILSMADTFALSQQYQKAAASPFSSESIGSYSYSKAASRIQKREETGVMWFDLAINKLSVCDIDDDTPRSGGIEVFEFDNEFTSGHRAGNVRVLAPRDIDAPEHWS